VIEGPRLLAEALDASVPILEVYAEADPGVPYTAVRPGVLDGVGDAATSQGVLAVAALPPLTPPAAPGALGERPLVLVLVDVADPGNVGTLLRAADAAGVALVLLTPGCADVASPKVVRASAGALFRVPVAELDALDALAWLAERDVPAWAAMVRGGQDPAHLDLAGASALVLGNEAHGLPPEVVAAASGAVTLAMPGRSESLNVAMAGTVLVFEALRQRRPTG
jgi:TrmH family RNA methyltransferase